MSHFYNTVSQYLKKAKVDDEFIIYNNDPKKDFKKRRIYTIIKLYNNGLKARNRFDGNAHIYLRSSDSKNIIHLNPKDYENWK